MERMTVEQTFPEPLSTDDELRSARRLEECLERHGARWMRSCVSLDRTRIVCEFEAPDAEAVRVSYRSAGLTFDRVWVAEVFARAEAVPGVG